MKQEVKIGQTDYTVLILVRDTAGAPKTGLVFNSAGIDVCYTRVETDNDVVLTAGAPVDLASPALTDPHLDWGFLQVDATNAPGVYRLDLPDGVFAAGAWSAIVSLICTGCDPTQIEFMLIPEAPYTGVDVASIGGTGQTAGDLKSLIDTNKTELDGLQGADGKCVISTDAQDLSATLDVNTKTITAGIIAMATLAVDIGSTVYANNKIALAVRKVLDELNLDHLMKVAVANRATLAEVVDDTVLANLMTKTDGDTSDFDHATDSLEAIKDEAAAIKAVTDVETGVKAAVAALNNLSAANVNTEVADVLKTDTLGEPAQGAPGATLSIEDKIAFMYKFMRNKITNDGTDIKVFNDAGAVVDHKAPVAEAAGTVTRGEFVTGP